MVAILDQFCRSTRMVHTFYSPQLLRLSVTPVYLLSFEDFGKRRRTRKVANILIITTEIGGLLDFHEGKVYLHNIFARQRYKALVVSDFLQFSLLTFVRIATISFYRISSWRCNIFR